MKSKRAKATDITRQTRMIVALRDNGICVICGKQGIPNAHYIPRSRGGLGIEENIVTLCLECHHQFDNGKHRTDYGEKIESYLRGKYKNWDKEKLFYRKWSDNT